MTGYHIGIGYNSNHSETEVWQKLKEITHEICKNPARIIKEDGGCIPIKYTKSYLEPWQDLTIKILENDKQIVQLASGGGMEREFKERMRRAFIRLIMKEMHKYGMEINVHII